MVTVKKKINEQPVIRTVKSDGLTDSFKDYHIETNAGFGSANGISLWLRYNFGSAQQRIVVRVLWGNKTHLMQEFLNTNEVLIDITPGVNGNGGTINQTNEAQFIIQIHISEPQNVTEMTWTSSHFNNSRTGWNWSYLSTNFVNLKKVSLLAQNRWNVASVANIPSIEYINITGHNNCSGSGILSLINLKYVIFNRVDNAVSNLPDSVRYYEYSPLGVNTFDLKDFFKNTNRMGLSIKAITNNSIKMSYSGGAIFPEHIVEEVGMPIPYILLITGSNLMIPTKLTPDMVSKFLVDFANQVKTVTLVNKRMRLQNLSANTSYVDNTQPIYQTYTDALNYIVNTLGITVTFT